MRLIKVGIGNINTTVGAVKTNTDRALAMAKKMSAQGAILACFQEQLISGYPTEDLVFWPSFIEAQKKQITRFVSETIDFPTVFVFGATVAVEGSIYNAVFVVGRGRILGIVPKEQLPNYNVFYERRTYSPGHVGERRTLEWGGQQVPFGDLIFDVGFGRFAVEVCEDIWSNGGPIGRRVRSGAGLVVNVSASPFRLGIKEKRKALLAERSATHGCTIVYANAVGANDSLVFDGGGYVYQNGQPVFEAPRWREGCVVVGIDLDAAVNSSSQEFVGSSLIEYNLSLDQSGAARDERDISICAEEITQSPLEELWVASTLFVGDYFEKSGAFERFGVSLSGGRDSLLCTLIVWNYLWHKVGAEVDLAVRQSMLKDKLRLFWMPSHYSSLATRKAAFAAAEGLGLPIFEVSINEAIASETAVTLQMTGLSKLGDITAQNIQSRIRGMRMWNWANAENGLFVQTSNMTEKATGYTTIGGDMMGAISPIANIPKTMVTGMLQLVAEKYGFKFIDDVFAVPASAELRPDQEDERDLMPFPFLDAMIGLHVGERMDVKQMTETLKRMFPDREKTVDDDVRRFLKLFSHSVFKWVQSPMAAHLGDLDLDRERTLQLPVVTSQEWLEDV